MDYNIWKTYSKEPWYSQISSYIRGKYQDLVNEMASVFTYIEPVKENRNVYSHKLSSILILSSIAFESTIKQIIFNAGLSYNQDIHGYLKFLRDNDDKLEFLEVGFSNSEGHFGLTPFKKIASIDQRPKWWDVYTNLKHNEMANLKEATFENTLDAVAANSILHSKICMVGGGAGIFYNVGIIDSPRSLLF